jgi:hypothetical protein
MPPGGGLGAFHHLAMVALLLSMLAPQASQAQCTYPTLSSGHVVSANISPQYFRVQPANQRWCAVAVRPLGGDWDLSIWNATAAAPNCVSGLLANSHRNSGVDVVAGDYNHIPPTSRYPVVTRGSGSVGYRAEFQEAQLLTPNSEWQTRTVGSSDIMDVYDIGLEAGVPYHFEFVNSGDCRLLVFQNPANAAYWAPRSSAIMDLVSSIEFTPTVTDRFGVIVLNETGLSGSYAFRVTACVPGEIRTLPSGLAHEAIPSLSYWSFAPATPAWSAIGLRDDFTDWDLYVGGPLGPSNYPACNTNPLASSVSTHRTEFVIGDFNTGANPLQEYFLTLNKQPGPSAGTLKWAGDGAQLTVGDPPVERSTDNVIDAWDLQLTAGKRYTIDFSAGNTDAQFYLFHNPGGTFWGARDNAVLTGNLAATYLAPATASYGFAVVHENSEDGMYSVAVCEGDLPSLASGIVAPVTAPTAKRLRQLRAYWAAAGVRSLANDWNLELRRGACNLGDALVSSNATSGVDFAIGDFNHAPTGDYSVRATRGAGNGNALLEWDDGGDQLLPGMPAVTRRTGPDDVLEVWDAYLVGGRNYEIYFGRLGAADTRLLLFDSQGTAMFGERADALIETQNPYTDFTPPRTDYYGIVVVNDNGADGNYAVSVASTVTDLEETTAGRSNALQAVFPNPTSGRLRIDYVLKESSPTSVEIVDVAGRIVASRSVADSQAGTKHIEWDGLDAHGRHVPAGIYWARLSIGGRAVGTRKFLVLR